ncbi:hypothetical protein Ahy_A06g030352 [Arachis hypogaea]|uniref:DUF4283 domain-containing protein n=1 Tax=Arachis hypogaea TaxID=3818 RepID=A0A445CW02_ARAHY|nr:hypothetical protein Ahy_A06g030352 [Arachis hypogaea]
MWAKTSCMDLIDVGNDYFVVKLYNAEDYSHIMEGGSWLLLDHYLMTRYRTPDFNPFGTDINKIVALIRLPDIPIKYYDKKFLGLDKFARLCVELDLNKSLNAIYLVNECSYYIEYEGLHMISFACERFGHVNESWTKKRQEVHQKEDGTAHRNHPPSTGASGEGCKHRRNVF